VTALEIAPPGASAPLGATGSDGGVNFSVFSKDASRIDLLLFGNADATEPSHVIPLDPQAHRTYHCWHGWVPGIGPGQVYGCRAAGPCEPDRGLRFDADKLLLDPYRRAVAVPRAYDRRAAARPGSNVATGMKSVVTDRNGYDWEGDRPLGRPFAETIIYELHVRGFTRHPSSGVAPGKLGITAVELLPVFQFDPQDAPAGLTNYWG
jgi:glycogen operon protein